MCTLKTSKKETILKERFYCKGYGCEENLHIQRFKGYHKAIMCYPCHDRMNIEIQQIIGVDEDETLLLTDEGVEISNVKTMFADQVDSEH